VPDFRQAVKFNGIPVIGFVPQAMAFPGPTTPIDGQVWYDTTNKLLKTYNVTTAAWVPCELGAAIIVDAMVSATAAIQESKLALATDAVAATGSRRTIGAGALQAMAGNTRLDQIAAPTNPVVFNAQRATGLADPSGTTVQDAATANWVTNQIALAIAGQDWKQSVALATAAALSPANTYSAGVLTASGNGILTVDGVNPSVGQRILVKNEATTTRNGIYVVTNPGAAGAAYVLTRAADANTSAEISGGTTVPVDSGGTANGGTIWLLATTEAVVLDTTALTFTQIGAAGAAYSAGTGITLAGNVFSLTAPVTVALGGTGSTTAAGARTNLGAPGMFESAAIGDGASLVLTVTHNLNNQLPIVRAWDVSGASPIAIECDVTATTVNAVTLSFAVAPAASSVKCVVMG
jgi:hypothetical protein